MLWMLRSSRQAEGCVQGRYAFLHLHVQQLIDICACSGSGRPHVPTFPEYAMFAFVNESSHSRRRPLYSRRTRQELTRASDILAPVQMNIIFSGLGGRSIGRKSLWQADVGAVPVAPVPVVTAVTHVGN